jgi:hypothetical protein
MQMLEYVPVLRYLNASLLLERLPQVREMKCCLKLKKAVPGSFHFHKPLPAQLPPRARIPRKRRPGRASSLGSTASRAPGCAQETHMLLSAAPPYPQSPAEAAMP